jgi:hypothetical protein
LQKQRKHDGLIVHRSALTALVSRQRQQERQLHAWQRSAADEAACARVHFRLLAGELRALDLHESVRNTIEQADAHAALMQELSTARAHLSDALERAGRAEAEVVFTSAATRHGADVVHQQVLDNARADLSCAHAELPSLQEALEGY